MAIILHHKISRVFSDILEYFMFFEQPAFAPLGVGCFLSNVLCGHVVCGALTIYFIARRECILSHSINIWVYFFDKSLGNVVDKRQKTLIKSVVIVVCISCSHFEWQIEARYLSIGVFTQHIDTYIPIDVMFRQSSRSKLLQILTS